MGFGDKFKDLAKQAQDAVAEHKDQIVEAVDRASVMADERTGGKYTDKIAKASEKAGHVVEKLSASEEPSAADGQDSPAGANPPPRPPEPPAFG